jgi:biopolymer transport protein ExbD
MAFGSFNREGAAAPMAEINMIPLIDVMLVLLVIFIITAPLLTHAVKVDLPKASSKPNVTKPDNVQLAVSAEGEVAYRKVAEVMADAARSVLTRIGFVTEPGER